MFIAYQILMFWLRSISKKIWVQIWCICSTHICVIVDNLIGLAVRSNSFTVKIVSFFVNSQDNAVKQVEIP